MAQAHKFVCQRPLRRGKDWVHPLAHPRRLCQPPTGEASPAVRLSPWNRGTIEGVVMELLGMSDVWSRPPDPGFPHLFNQVFGQKGLPLFMVYWSKVPYRKVRNIRDVTDGFGIWESGLPQVPLFCPTGFWSHNSVSHPRHARRTFYRSWLFSVTIFGAGFLIGGLKMNA